MRPRATRLSAVALGATMIVGLTATAAWAPKYLLGPVTVSGSECSAPQGQGTLSGATFEFLRFARDGDTLLAVGTLNGTCDLTNLSIPIAQDVAVALTRELPLDPNDCTQIIFLLGEGSFVHERAGAMSVDLGSPTSHRIHFAYDDTSNKPGARNKICNAAHLLDSQPAGRTAGALNGLLQGLGI